MSASPPVSLGQVWRILTNLYFMMTPNGLVQARFPCGDHFAVVGLEPRCRLLHLESGQVLDIAEQELPNHFLQVA